MMRNLSRGPVGLEFNLGLGARRPYVVCGSFRLVGVLVGLH